MPDGTLLFRVSWIVLAALYLGLWTVVGLLVWVPLLVRVTFAAVKETVWIVLRSEHGRVVLLSLQLYAAMNFFPQGYRVAWAALTTDPARISKEDLIDLSKKGDEEEEKGTTLPQDALQTVLAFGFWIVTLSFCFGFGTVLKQLWKFITEGIW